MSWGTPWPACDDDPVAVGHVARDVAGRPLDREGDDVVAARVVAGERVAAEVGQASRAREVQGVRAVRQAVEHLERGRVRRAVVSRGIAA